MFCSFIVVSKLVFVDDVADKLEVEHATVVVLDKDHGVMDIIRWIEKRHNPDPKLRGTHMFNRQNGRRQITKLVYGEYGGALVSH